MYWVFKWQTLCFAHYLLQQDGLCLTDSNYSGHNLEGAWTRVAQLIGFGWQWSSVAQKLTSLSFHSQFFGTLKSIGLQLNTVFIIILTADYWSSKLIIFFCFWIIKHLKKCPLQFLNGRQNVLRCLVRWTKSSERKDTQFTVVCVRQRDATIPAKRTFFNVSDWKNLIQNSLSFRLGSSQETDSKKYCPKLMW